MERKKQPKEAERSAISQPAQPSSGPVADSSASEPAKAADATADAAAEASGQAELQASDDTAFGNNLTVKTDALSSSESVSLAPAPDQQNRSDQQAGEQNSSDVPHNGHAEHAEPHDVLHEFEQLSPKLPDMPKQDMQDDLAGLFQAAFATCRTEMSPCGAPPQSPFSSHGQDREEEDFSLYEDADQAIEGDEPDNVALDASDEEQEERSGEMAKPLLEGFVGDAVAQTLDGNSTQVCDLQDCLRLHPSCSNMFVLCWLQVHHFLTLACTA